ncbi:hypothetical protein [Bacillus cereus group sp. BfR-BA-01331]|uniref:hypothetical protein n=1 Tax=Bacillus cereus group sp. BfR-BA-01331 TaxID=2920307 RepID=UPI001F561EC2|nr:hypothetical protein [Bacillus cereus group sp. BfR-BA-01331]
MVQLFFRYFITSQLIKLNDCSLSTSLLNLHETNKNVIPQSGPIVEEGEQRSPIDYNFLYTSA